MPLLNQVRQLLSVSPAQNTGSTGAKSVVIPSDNAPRDANGITFAAMITLSLSGGASSPTVDCVVETSVDGTNWVTVASATQVTTAITQTEIKAINTLALYVRARTTLGGGTPPNHTATVNLMSDTAFQIQPAP